MQPHPPKATRVFTEGLQFHSLDGHEDPHRKRDEAGEEVGSKRKGDEAAHMRQRLLLGLQGRVQLSTFECESEQQEATAAQLAGLGMQSTAAALPTCTRSVATATPRLASRVMICAHAVECCSMEGMGGPGMHC